MKISRYIRRYQKDKMTKMKNSKAFNLSFPEKRAKNKQSRCVATVNSVSGIEKVKNLQLALHSSEL